MQLDKKWEKLMIGEEGIKELRPNLEKLKLINNKKYQCLKANWTKPNLKMIAWILFWKQEQVKLKTGETNIQKSKGKSQDM